MRFNHRSLGAAAAVSALLVSPLFAQKLAVEGKTPANPTMMMSIPDSQTFWRELTSSGFGASLVDQENGLLQLPGDVKDRLATAGSQLGVDLAPAGFFTDTITGLDFYMVEHSTLGNFVINFNFANPEVPGKVLDLIRREATAAYGVSGGVSADTVIVDAAPGVRSLYLPAFEIYLAADGPVLTYSNYKAALESALANKGRAVHESDYFERYMSQLRDVPSEVWIFGETQEATPLFTKGLPIESILDSGMGGTQPQAVKIDFSPDSIKIVSFRHERDMSAPSRRYTLSAPPAGAIDTLNFFPNDSLLVFGMNHFDGLAHLEMVSETLDAADRAPVSSQEVNQQLDGLTQLMGFDPRNDLLANLGPELGVAITGLGTEGDSAAGFTLPDFLFVAKVKDTSAFQPVVDALTGLLEASATPPAPPASASGNNAAPAGPPPAKKETYQGTEITYVDMTAPGSGQAIQPAMAMTADGRFLLSSSLATLKEGLDLYKGTGNSVLTAAGYRKAGSMLSESRNVELYFNLASAVAALSQYHDVLTADENEDMKMRFDALLGSLRQAEALSSITVFSRNGSRQELVLTLK